MNVIKTKLQNCVIIKPELFGDERGFFLETFQTERYANEAGISLTFVQDNHSRSSKGVLRGLHFQRTKPQGKLVRVVRGEVYDVAVDIRKNSSTFGEYFTIYISASDNTSLYIPEGFAHGFCSLANDTVLYYKNSNYRNKKYESGIIWNDKDLKIKWPIKKPIISLKDKKNLNFSKFLNSKFFKKL